MTRYTKLTKNVIQITNGNYNAIIIRKHAIGDLPGGWSLKIRRGVASGPVVRDFGIIKYQTDARIMAMAYLDDLDRA